MRPLRFVCLVIGFVTISPVLFSVSAVSPVPTKTRILENISPGIDLEIREEENLLSYRWTIEKDGDPERIRFVVKPSGPGPGHWVCRWPQAFEVINGKKNMVEVEILRKQGNQLGFGVKGFNKGRREAPLFIGLEMEKCYNTSPGNSKRENTATITSGTTYYVRTDGGTSTECTGTADAPYPGSGTNQPCAWSHPFWALDSDGDWKISGGDTLIIGPGSYKMGYGAPNTSGWCESDYPYDCDLPPLPSGPDANNPTRILGAGWDWGCPNPPELWGTERAWYILDLTSTSNAVVGCLEITDHSSCVEHHSNSSAACERNNFPYGDWASSGLAASDSANVWLKDLDIHGLASHGIIAARLTDWTMENVRIAGNGWVGWEGDLSEGNNSNSGTLLFKNVTIEWNGCGETYPGEQPHNCWGQTAGGYGDGLGTGATGGHWIFQDCIIRYNSSDGLDLLYNRIDGSQIDIKRSQFYGNAGNALKVTGNAAIENCLLVGNCGFFSGQSFTYHVDDCRALGNTVNASLRKGSTFSLVNSTVVGHGDCLVSVECDTESSTCNGTERVTIQNNVFQGYQEFASPSDRACYIWMDQDGFYSTSFDYNVIYDAKIGNVGYSANDINQDPLFVDDNLASFDGHLQASSPAIDSGLWVGALGGLIPGEDLEGNTRPAGSGVDRGAYEYGSSTSSITVTAPNGGETWAGGSTQSIGWTSSGNVGNVKLEYSTNNGSTWSVIVASTANDGSHSWQVPGISSSQCLVKISETDGNPTDTSNAVFTITWTSASPEIDLSHTELYFGVSGSFATPSQLVFVNNNGKGSLNWAAVSDRSWLTCTPASGTGDGAVTLRVNGSGLAVGKYSAVVIISDPNASNSPQRVDVDMTIIETGKSDDPFGLIDSPEENAQVRGGVAISGWALDDIEVAEVMVYRLDGEKQIKLGKGVFVEDARWDVELDHPGYPLNYKAGWGYMLLSNYLPGGGNGSYKLQAIATDVEGNRTDLGTRTIIVDNTNSPKPFGAIDTPAQGGTASGQSFLNWGWALTPRPNYIPTDGSTILVNVNGKYLGSPEYNMPRWDIDGLFPGYINTGGAVGLFYLDTTVYKNGMHNIHWLVTDNAGNRDGVGSRYFTVYNRGNRGASITGTNGTGAFPGVSVEKIKGMPFGVSPLLVRRGHDDGVPPEPFYRDDTGVVEIKIGQLERVVFYLGQWPTGEKNFYHGRYWGFLLVGRHLRSLPVGSTLDATKGIFYWQPGPGFTGPYRLIFGTFEQDGQMVKTDVRVNINPRFSSQ